MSKWNLSASPPVWYMAFWALMFVAYCLFWTWKGK